MPTKKWEKLANSVIPCQTPRGYKYAQGVMMMAWWIWEKENNNIWKRTRGFFLSCSAASASRGGSSVTSAGRAEKGQNYFSCCINSSSPLGLSTRDSSCAALPLVIPIPSHGCRPSLSIKSQLGLILLLTFRSTSAAEYNNPVTGCLLAPDGDNDTNGPC